jgi:RHS repeat-associated protein
MTTTRTFDKLNRLWTMASTPAGNPTRPLRYEYNYNDANQRVNVLHGDGSYWVYNYDRLGQVASAKKFWNDGTPVAGQQFEYGHDDIGNRIETRMGGDSEGQGLRTATYTSNERNQYTGRTFPGAVDVLGIAHGLAGVTVNGTAAYRKGEYFHRTVSVDNVTPAAGAYPSLTTQASRAGFTTETTTGNVFLPKTPEGFTHDADGNLTFDGRWIYTWNAENRLIRMESYSGAPLASRRRVQMDYDFQGRRIQRIVSTHNGTSWVVQSTLRYLYDGWNLIAELNAANAVQRTFIWGTDLSGTMQGAGGVGGLLMVRQVVTPAMTHYVAYDGNGNITGLVNASTGDYSALYEYDPFGQTIRITGTMAKNNPFRFSTKYTDDATDMVYYGYRYYNPSTGRWLSRDPIEELGGIHLYAFVGNDTFNAVDVLGMAICRQIRWTTEWAPLEEWQYQHSVKQRVWDIISLISSPVGFIPTELWMHIYHQRNIKYDVRIYNCYDKCSRWTEKRRRSLGTVTLKKRTWDWYPTPAWGNDGGLGNPVE